MLFVIFHGSFGSPEGNWFPDLKERLEALGQEVLAPSFPTEEWDALTKQGPSTTPLYQNLSNWTSAFEKNLPIIKKQKKVCFVGHSLGPLFILHMVEKYNLVLDSAIFVSPFLEDIGGDWQFKAVNKTFYKTDFDWEELKKLIPLSYVLYSDNDPYVKERYSIECAKHLGSSLVQVKRAGHMNSEVNLNEFPLVLELCKSRIDLSLYQRYLDYRHELYLFDHNKANYEEVIYIDPTEVFNEGSFKFKNLRKGGFCTFFTGLRFWDTQARYYQEARKAAARVPLTRVFVVEKLSDLERQNLRDQIELDIKGGVNVYMVMREEIQHDVTTPDFGIWDNEYVCVIGFGKGSKIKGIKLSSRKDDVAEATKWKEFIEARATRIKSLSDIPAFVKKYTFSK